MGILFESSTHIEYLLRNALLKEKLEFKEQYRIYEGGSFSQVKYVADFLVISKSVKLIVECDGFQYHAGSKNIRKQKERDEWLRNHGYDVLHFSSQMLQRNMKIVINIIKRHLELHEDKNEKALVFSNNINKNKFDKSINGFNVLLFCYFMQSGNDVIIVYRYKSILKNQWSEERKKICTNVPKDMLETTAIYLALLDLKKPVSIKIFYSGKIYSNNLEIVKYFRSNIKKLLFGKRILNKNIISTSYVGFYGDYRFSKREPQKTMNELKSRCLQVVRNKNTLESSLVYEFSKITNRN